MREGYAEVMVDAKVWRGQPNRWWRRPAEGLKGQQLVDLVTAMAGRYPDNIRLN